MSHGTTSADTDLGKATLFNDYFYSVYTNPDSAVATSDLTNDQTNVSILEQVEFEELDVYRELTQLDPNKAAGIDGIGPMILKHCALGLYKPIPHIFKLSLSTHSFPTEWYTHLIVPIFKNGDRTQVNNYRPISLLVQCF